MKQLYSLILALAVVLACGAALAADAGPPEAPGAAPSPSTDSTPPGTAPGTEADGAQPGATEGHPAAPPSEATGAAPLDAAETPTSAGSDPSEAKRSETEATEALLAASTATDPLWSVAKRIYDEIRAGNWREAGALALIFVTGFLIWLTKSWGKAGRWVANSDVGGTLFVFATSALGALGTALLASESVTLGLFRESFVIGVMAAGGYSVLYKKVVKRALVKIGWMKG